LRPDIKRIEMTRRQGERRLPTLLGGSGYSVLGFRRAMDTAGFWVRQAMNTAEMSVWVLVELEQRGKHCTGGLRGIKG
jgi:hypothetical protein